MNSQVNPYQVQALNSMLLSEIYSFNQQNGLAPMINTNSSQSFLGNLISHQGNQMSGHFNNKQ